MSEGGLVPQGPSEEGLGLRSPLTSEGGRSASTMLHHSATGGRWELVKLAFPVHKFRRGYSPISWLGQGCPRAQYSLYDF
jgi:hypothetical protein